MRLLFPALLLCLSCTQQASRGAEELEADLNGPVQGQILYNGRPITEVTKAPPSFWFRNEETGRAVEARVVAEGSRFAVRGLPAGSYGIQVTINANPNNTVNSPGDYYSWTPFRVEKNGTARIPVEVSRIIHLLLPIDNSRVLPGWEEEGCEPGATVPHEATFRWEPVENEAEYLYEIRKISCPYRDQGVVAFGTTGETQFKIALPSSGTDQFYLMTLRATKAQKRIGILMTWGPNFLAWDYRFRVSESLQPAH